MGTLIEQNIAGFFQGVSRQPDPVRLVGQVEEGVNVVFSVVTGGFEKRPFTSHVSALANAPAGAAEVYSYARDAAETYFIVVTDGDLKVYDKTGAERTVVFPDGKAYLASAAPVGGFAFATLLDTTIIVNRNVTVAMDAATAPATIYGPANSFNDLPRYESGIPTYLKGYDTNANSKWESTDTGCSAGSIWKVQPEAKELSKYFVKLEVQANNTWVWNETADPNHPNAFDASTMPHQLVREADGTFTFKRIEWSERKAGDPDITPNPDFVGQKIRDIAFFRDRLTVVADEQVYTSQAGDYFNFWPDSAYDVIDSDPIGRVASSPKVNVLEYAVPFRRSLFMTSSQAQFELSSGDSEILSPNRAVVDLSTSYELDANCRPLVLGDELYFIGRLGDSSAVFEYYYEEASVSNTAAEASKHVVNYIPSNIRRMVGDTVSQTLMLLPSTGNEVYVYRQYWDGETKAQRAWGRFIFPAYASLLHIAFHNSLFWIIGRMSDGSVHMATLDINARRGPKDHPYLPSLDHVVLLTGVHADGETTFTLPYPHDGLEFDVVLSTDFSGTGRVFRPTKTGTHTLVVQGDLSGGECLVGVRLPSYVDMSKLYPRESEAQGARSITTGRCQMKRLTLTFEDTAFFQVVVTPEGRPPKTHTFTGRVLGSVANILGGVPVRPDGVFKVRINSRSDRVAIRITSDEHMPFRITSARWHGFFNELSRQEN